MIQYAPAMYPIDGAAGNLIPAVAGKVFKVNEVFIQPQDATVSEITLKEDTTALSGPMLLDQSGAAGETSVKIGGGLAVSQLDLAADGAGVFGGYVLGCYLPE